MPRIVELCGLVVAVVVGASMAGAQQKTSPMSHKAGRILGVFDDESGLPIPDAEVTDLFVEGVAHTESHGLVELSQFSSRNDSAAVRIRKVGFADTAFVVMVGAADTVPVQVNLHKAGVALPTVTVNASANTMMVRRLQEFEDRRKVGLGKYVLSDELLRKADRNIADLLFDDGLKCGTYSINGVPHTSPAAIETALRDNADNFIGVEFYDLASMPPQFAGTGSRAEPTVPCIIILWTRY